MNTQTSHQPTKRVEDDYLLRGTGRYMADAPLPGQTYASFVRSQHACADVKSIDTKAALAIKGVIAVITAADIKAANVGNLSQHPPGAGRGGAKLIMPVRPALAGDRVQGLGRVADGDRAGALRGAGVQAERIADARRDGEEAAQSLAEGLLQLGEEGGVGRARGDQAVRGLAGVVRSDAVIVLAAVLKAVPELLPPPVIEFGTTPCHVQSP